MSSSICYSPVTKQRISRWLVDAITLAYSSSGCSAPSESEPTPPEASPRPGHGPAGCPCQILWGGRLVLAIHICKVLQPACPRLAGQSPFCFSSNLSGSLDQHFQSPLLLGLSINIWMPGITYGTTPRSRKTLKAHPVLGVFYGLPWVLPTWVFNPRINHMQL